MSTENQQTDDTASKDFSTGADATLLALQGLASEKGVQLLDAASGAPGEPADDVPGDEPNDEAQGEEPAGEPLPAAAKPEDSVAPKDKNEYLTRLAAKDAKLQQTRNENAQLRNELAQMRSVFEDLRSNPITGLHKHFRLTTTDLNKMAFDLGDPPSGTQHGSGDAEMPAWAREMRAQNERLQQQLEAYQQRETTQQQQQARAAEVGRVATYLGQKPEDFPVINDLGRADLVYERVIQHVGQHGAFESEREAAEIVEQYARQVEEQLRSELLGYTSKPGVSKWLLGQLGAQNAAKPARQETRAPNGARNGARPAIPNGLTTQRSTRTNQQEDWSKLPFDEQLRRTAEQAVTRVAR